MSGPAIILSLGGMALCALLGFIFGELSGRIEATRESADRMQAEHATRRPINQTNPAANGGTTNQEPA